jgi:RES domain-containing protein
MLCFRLVKAKYGPLDPTGAVRNGGRWNSIGNAALYFGSTAALCILESRVHTPRMDRVGRLLHTIELPEGSVATLDRLGLKLPADWQNKPAPASTMQFGDSWLRSNASLGVFIPSVPSPKDMNILVNPLHKDFIHVRVLISDPYLFDPRLYPLPVTKKPRKR